MQFFLSVAEPIKEVSENTHGGIMHVLYGIPNRKA